MNRSDALALIAERFGFDAAALEAFAAEDTYGGYHSAPALATMPIGCVWGVEGEILYILVRVLKPATVIELGTFAGGSAIHIAAALKANGTGKLICVDKEAGGELIPEDLLDVVTFEQVEGVAFLDKTKLKSIDLIFEDMMHSREEVAAAWRLGAAKLRTGGVIVSHDAMHHIVGADVRAGITDAGYDTLNLLIEPSDCGLALWRKQ